MEMTNELLAAYSEGNITEPEREAVRQYLTDNPAELETVMMMMDEDYELEVDDDVDNDVDDRSAMKIGNVFSDICYSAAAFAPCSMPMKGTFKSPPNANKNNFSQRLDDLLDDIIG